MKVATKAIFLNPTIHKSLMEWRTHEELNLKPSDP